MPDKKTKFDNELLAQNRKARFHYHVLESLEAGMEVMDRDTERQGNQRARRKAQRRDDRNADDPE